MGRGILLWLLGVPIPIIIVLALLGTREETVALATQPPTTPAALVTDEPSAVGDMGSKGSGAAE